jgi:hypothetical protein
MNLTDPDAFRLIERKFIDGSSQKARQQDFDQFGDTPSYFLLVETVYFATSVRRLLDSEDVFAVIDEGREAITNLLQRSSRMRISQFCKWGLSFLESAEKMAGPRPKQKPKSSSALSPEDISKRLNKRIILLFNRGTTLEGILANLVKFIVAEGVNLNLINAITILHRLGEATSHYDFEHCSDEISDILKSVASIIENSTESPDEQGIANSLYGLRNFKPNFVPSELLNALQIKILQPRVNLRTNAILGGLSGLILLQNVDETRELMTYLLEEFNNLRQTQFTEAQIMALRQNLSLLGLEVPSWFESVYDSCLRSKSHEPNPVEAFAHEVVCQAYSGEVSSGIRLDGFELDLYITSKKVNIEIDGQHHFASRFRDESRDDYLLNQYGIETIRIPWTGSYESLKQALEQIQI